MASVKVHQSFGQGDFSAIYLSCTLSVVPFANTSKEVTDVNIRMIKCNVLNLFYFICC